ncbi:MAG: acyl dehydratase [Deltaproteobacteria bacterium HGW-Deltaproteobacteria-14]|jgi:2-methylfumaryl-CoA hydratase|nr:MAG: acyl dehydratase [Deltaproteobacteria bacterium HGW-Deltaproteobacteria-14]
MTHLSFDAEPFDALAPKVPVALDRVRAPEYGHTLEDFVPGTVFAHPRGVTLTRGGMLAYATTFMEANPLYLNEAYAMAMGYDALPAAPHLVMNLALSLGVQNDSEKAIANLGYYDVRFLRPVYARDTLTGKSRVVDRKDRGPGKPGIVTVETLAENQRDDVVIQYRRKIFVPRRGSDPIDATARATADVAFPFAARPTVRIPWPALRPPTSGSLTSPATTLEAFTPGDVIVHRNGRTITDEHVPWTYGVMNTHPLHYDRLYSTALAGPMSGEPIVYGGLVFAWLLGLASRDATENAVWDLGYHDGYHTQPTFAGETIAALTRVLAVEPWPDRGAGVVRMQLIGVKGMRAEAALDRFGADLFVNENAKKALGKDKIKEKIFEIERAVLIRSGRY